MKRELQGQKGLINHVKKALMPRGAVIAEEAAKDLGHIHRRISHDSCRRDFNDLLYDVLRKEYHIYLQYEEKIFRRHLITYLLRKKQELSNDFPLTVLMLNNLNRAVGESSMAENQRMAKIYDLFYPFFESLFQSIQQGRRTRAGGSMQYQLANLFRIAGLKYESQIGIDGPIDFILPSKRYFHRHKHDSIILSVKRTLRERWAEVIAELQSAEVGRIYIATAEEKPIPSGTLDRMRRLNVTLVVFDQLKQQYHRRHHTVISYSEFVNTDLEHAESLWNRRGKSI